MVTKGFQECGYDTYIDPEATISSMTGATDSCCPSETMFGSQISNGMGAGTEQRERGSKRA